MNINKMLKLAVFFKNDAFINKLESVQKIFPQAKITKMVEAKQYVLNIAPKIIYTNIIQCRSLKQCSEVAPLFAAIASKDGFATLIASAPNHYYNVMLTEEGPMGVDLTALQFKANSLADKILENDDEEWDEIDPMGERRAKEQLLSLIVKNPYETVRIWHMNYTVGEAPYASGISEKLELKFDKKDQEEQYPAYMKQEDKSVVDEAHPLYELVNYRSG